MVEYVNTSGSNFAVDSCELSVNDVVPYEQRVLSDQVPRGVESTGFEEIEGRKDTITPRWQLTTSKRAWRARKLAFQGYI